MQQVLGGTHQGRLDDVVRNIFGGVHIIRNARKLAQIKNPYTSGYLELDIWVPKYNICFEFQDTYHYVTTWYYQESVSNITARDSLKTEALRKRDETLITVPCWWDGAEQSLISTVNFFRPDIFQNLSSYAMPIPCNPNTDFFKPNGIPGVGELMYASFPLSEQFVDTISPFDTWWLGEKYDGVRACWNGNNLHSRFGIVLDIPNEQVSLFRGLSFLDCEIWFGRGSFTEAQKVVTQDVEESGNDWSMLRAIGFDQPSPRWRFSEFEHRYAWIQDCISPHHPFITIAPRIKCDSKHTLTLFLKTVLTEGGEGVVLRRPKSIYTSGRSSDLLKLKASRGDLEALTVAINVDDKSLTLRLPNGITFEVGPENILPTIAPNPGEVVSVSFENYSRRDVPTNPFVERVRHDLTWENVLQSDGDESAPHFLDESSSKVLGFSAKPSGYWKERENNNMRSFFEEYAQDCGFDALVAHNWYSVKHSDILQRKGGRAVLANFQGSMRKALLSLFPDIGLDISKFDVVPSGYWHDTSNRKRFFDMYAKVNKFDPLIPNNWYDISYKHLLRYKGSWAVLKYYDSINAALSHVYPDIGIDKRKFKFSPRNQWKDSNLRRQFFVNYAKQHNFDPLVAANWYQISSAHFTFEKGGPTLVQIYRGSVALALQDLFPEVAFDVRKFTRSSSGFWSDDNNKRKFFLHFAREKRFDPLVASNWYSVSVASIVAHKAARIVLSFFRGSPVRALLYLFPNIGLNKKKFRSYKQDATMKRIAHFFSLFAQERGIDALVAANWYPVKFNSLWCRKGAATVLQHSSGNFANGLLEVFPNIGLEQSKFIELNSTQWRQYDRSIDTLTKPRL